MRYVAALATILAVLTVFSAVPLAVCDSSDANPEDYISETDKLILEGKAVGAETSTVRPVIYVFVVYYDVGEDKYLYINANEGKMLSCEVSTTEDADGYNFSISVPKISIIGADYYICAFNNFRIEGVPNTLAGEPELIEPDPAEWGTAIVPSYNAYKVIQSTTNYWKDMADGTEVPLTEYSHVIYLKSATGTLSGHVSGIIGSTTSNLNDVLVQFYRGDNYVDSTRTDSSGNYTIELPTGEYTVKFSRGNYDCEPVKATVNEGTNTVPDVTMTLKVSNEFFGYDLSHFLTIIGGAVCTIIILISIAFQWRRIKRKKSGKDWILDDLEEIDEKEEE